MNTYTKLFTSILDSSIWQEADSTRITWITMLAMANQHGEVQASIPGLARRAGVAIADCQKAIDLLMAPDEFSRTPDHDGRRIAKIDGGWEILNHAKYRRMASLEDRKEKATERQRRHRKRDDALHSVTERDMSRVVTPSHAEVTPSHVTVTHLPDIAEAEAEAEADTEAEKQKNKDACAKHPTSMLEASNKQKTTPRFTPPTREELDLAASKIGLPSIEVDKFVAYYESNGWMVGRNKMKNWVGALSGWASRWRERAGTQRGYQNAPDALRAALEAELMKHPNCPLRPGYDDSKVSDAEAEEYAAYAQTVRAKFSK